MRRKILVSAIAALWLVAVVRGWSGMARFAHTPGAPASPPPVLSAALLPAGLPLARPGQPTLLVALHPQCSCSIATLHELARVLPVSKPPSQLAARPESQLAPKPDSAPLILLLLYTPSRRPAHWSRGEALLAAAQPLHAQVIPDIDGKIAASLGARTSGQVLLYAPGGALLFAGGVTDERGHEGPSSAGDLLAAALLRLAPAGSVPSVFGCPLAPWQASRPASSPRPAAPGAAGPLHVGGLVPAERLGGQPPSASGQSL